MSKPICTKCGEKIYGPWVEDIIYIGRHKLHTAWHVECYEEGLEGGTYLDSEDSDGWTEYDLEVKG